MEERPQNSRLMKCRQNRVYNIEYCELPLTCYPSINITMQSCTLKIISSQAKQTLSLLQERLNYFNLISMAWWNEGFKHNRYNVFSFDQEVRVLSEKQDSIAPSQKWIPQSVSNPFGWTEGRILVQFCGPLPCSVYCCNLFQRKTNVRSVDSGLITTTANRACKLFNIHLYATLCFNYFLPVTSSYVFIRQCVWVVNLLIT